MVDIPAGLFHAVTAEGGGCLALVIGAGCSSEPPTSIPVAGTLSREIERKLVMDGVLTTNECPDPSNLSALTSLIFDKTNSQEMVVNRFPIKQMRLARPNTGYKLLVALMAERAVSYVLSLNFDLAVQHAAAELGTSIEVVDAIGKHIPAAPTLVYLHGCINGDPEALILRQEVIDDGWRGAWEQVVANQILAAPNVLCAGLGSAAPVLTETVAMIAHAVGGTKTFYQADIVPHGSSAFAAALGVGAEHYIEGGWSEVLGCLSKRLVGEQLHTLEETGRAVLAVNGYTQDEIDQFSQLVAKLADLNLLSLGKMRPFALVEVNTSYAPRSAGSEERIAEPIAKLAAICTQKNLTARPTAGAVWALTENGRLVGTAMLASGGGVRRLAALEPSLRQLCASIGEASSPPDLIIVGGAVPGPVPVGDLDIIAEPEPHDIVEGSVSPLVIAADAADLFESVQRWLDAA